MSQSFNTIVEKLYAAKSGQQKFERMQRITKPLLKELQEVSFVHIAGTNGKGSTSAFLDRLLLDHGFSVGLFTSPHLYSVTERLKYNDEQITESDFVTLYEKTYRMIAECFPNDLDNLGFFEWLTVVNFVFLTEMRPDVAILEVGIGGLRDSTNVIDPDVTIITTVGLDHQKMLGNTIDEIAMQKAGIIKSRKPVYVGRMPEDALYTVEMTAQAYNAPVYLLDREFKVKNVTDVDSGLTSFDFINAQANSHYHLTCPLIGRYQVDNLALALACFEYLMAKKHHHVLEKRLPEILMHTSWPGRFEKVSTYPVTYIDSAHNVAAVAHLMLTVTQNPAFKSKSIVLVFSALTRKNYAEMLDFLRQKYPEYPIALTSFDDSHSLTKYLVTKWLQPNNVTFYPSIKAVLSKYRETDTQLICFGSIYFISEVRLALVGPTI